MGNREEKPHPSYPIIARAMRELAVWWPKPLILDGNEGLFIAVDISQSSVRENRFALTDQNYRIADKSYQWLSDAGLTNFSGQVGSRAASVTKKGSDLLHSLRVFDAYHRAQNLPDREALILVLDRELTQLLGPRFFSWLQSNQPGQ